MALGKRAGVTGVSAGEGWGCVSLTARRIWDGICSLAHSCVLFWVLLDHRCLQQELKLPRYWISIRVGL